MWLIGYVFGCIFTAIGFSFLVITDDDLKMLGKQYHCTRYEIIGESPDRHEVCAVYERKEGV